MKKKILKALLLAVSAVLLVVASVMGTLAYLTSSSAVSNTFTVGNVGIQMFESKVNSDGTYTPEANNGQNKTAEGNSYHLQPSGRYIKDPTVYVDANSDESYLFVKVRNDLRKVEAASGADGVGGTGGTYKTMAEQVSAHGWIFIGCTSNANVYVYNKFVGGKSEKEAIDIFNEFMIAKDADLSTSGGAKITLTAFAIQTTGFKPAGATDTSDKAAALAAWEAIGGVYDYEDTVIVGDTPITGSTT